MRAQHILVTDQKQAQWILSELESDNMSFSEAARSFSICSSKKQSGDLGTIQKGQMVKGFEAACIKAKLGKYIGPVRTESGYHIIRVIER